MHVIRISLISSCLVAASIIAGFAVPSLAFPAHAESSAPYYDATIVGQFGGQIRDVAVSGHYAYLAVGHRLAVFDISAPSSPLQVGQSSVLVGLAREVAANGTTVYVLDTETDTLGNPQGPSHLAVFDVSHPSSPTQVGSYDLPDGSYNLTASGSRALLTLNDNEGHHGIVLVDLSDPSRPRVNSGQEFPKSSGVKFLRQMFDLSRI